MRRQSIDLVYFNCGGGHRAAAKALQEVIRQQDRPWDVRLVNLFEVLDPKDLCRRLTGSPPEAYYNKRLSSGWTVGLSQELKLLQHLIRLFHGTIVGILQQHWLRTEPDLVVSLIPNFNRALCESVQATLPGVPYATVLTDMADFPPNFWIEPGQRQHVVCGTPHALAQARAAGYPDEQLSLSSGMLLHPSFYAAELADGEARARDRQALGLDPSRPTGIVLFGGHGSMQMVRIARQLRDRQLILMCGHNAVLAARLRAQASDAPHAVIGFSSEMARHLRMADYFIGKPGPGSISEAVQMGLPVITSCGAATMPQERYNARWVRESGVGLVLPSMRPIRGAVDEIVTRLPEFQARVRQLDNRAVFELPDILAGLLERAASPHDALPAGPRPCAPTNPQPPQQQRESRATP